MVSEYHKRLLDIARENFNTSLLPADTREDANDILIRLEENLDECQNALDNDHVLVQYKKCVHQQLDRAANEIWEFRDENESHFDHDNDDDHSSGNSLNLLVFLIPLNLILCFLNFI